MAPEQYNDYTKRLAASDYEILRTEPKVCTLIRQIHEGTIDHKKYPLVADRSVKKAAKAEGKRKGESEFERQPMDNPRILVFMFGGLSHHELVSIANL